MTVHFAGLPPGTSAMLFKFMPPDTVARFGGADALARAVATSLERLAGFVAEPARLRALLLGESE
jgi:L-seryl-tRNA(Ser) seleniumtransferase